MATRKVTVNLPEDQIEFLQQIAAKDHLTFTDALRRAINSEKFFVQQENAGCKVLVEGPDQRIREILRK
ncbi:CopG family transcriptional regulator [Methylovulum psychrotolerans]|uniref:CopG family transcriptional regulator n=1 Tax=Methylovulum psychrotolerans TaxID=1704499 RepID=A0A1Z4C493_9GAMM|nr:CopG family transcriptional regulator [Methylovulum psychrotolerans]ASF48376.1 CopG family transcriptional regulator [Methylovulum psychrotolerans]POZ52383.1 CopG family transcriptional regulator [Methylovulum psychrotolerans]